MELTDEFKQFAGWLEEGNTTNPINVEAIRTEDPYPQKTGPIITSWQDLYQDLASGGTKFKSLFSKEALDEWRKHANIEETALGFAGGGLGGITKIVGKELVSKEAMQTASKLAKESKGTHTLVNMSIDDFLSMAYPLSKTKEELAKVVKEVPSTKELAQNLVARKEKIRGYINKGGVNEVPYLDITGGQVISHEGRTRALVAKEMGLETIPVMIKDTTGHFGKGTPLHKRTLSESGESMMETMDLFKPIK